MSNNKAVPAEITHRPEVSSGSLTNLIHGDQALADAINAGLSTVRTLRAKRLIPYIKTGHKSVIYDLSKVLAALGTLEVKPVTGKGAR
jgi:hypothetical protein